MRPKRLAIYGFLLLAFSAVSGLAMWEHGYLELWKFTMAGSAHRQIFMDLAIASFLFLTWMRGDARARGLPFLPFAVITVLTGSFGLLGYMLYRELKRSPDAAPTPS